MTGQAVSWRARKTIAGRQGPVQRRQTTACMQQVGLLSYFAEQRSTPLTVNDHGRKKTEVRKKILFILTILTNGGTSYLSCPSFTVLLLRLAILDL